MGVRKILALAAVLAAGALLPAGSAAAKCRLAKYFDLPVAMEGPRAIVPVKIDGVDARFMVDTGDFYSMITPEAAKRMKLRGIPMPGIQVEGVGGSDFVSAGEAKEFVFAGVPLKNIQFIIGGREFAPGTVGLLGENVLGVADVEYDFAHGMMRFFKEEDCYKTDLAYWANGASDSIHIDSVTPMSPNIVGTVKVNGKTVRAEFDSGSPSSTLTLSAAERAGIRTDGPGVEAAGLATGIGHGARETWIAPVESFSIGGEEIKHTRLRIAKMDLGDVDMLLGMDFFLSHRILVSHRQDKLFFSYNGGPVFRLDQPPEPPATTGKPEQAAAAQAASADAEALAREGGALMSRRDFKGALKLFARAVELQPKTAQRYLDRARAQAALGDLDAAVGDYGRALELKPNDAPTLLERGGLFLRKGDLAKASADFDAAVKGSPGDDGIHLKIAAAYAENDRYAEAVPHYDAWIDRHRKSDEAWEALNARCWARAMAGQDLDKALADCNAALRNGPRNSEVLDSRGMVRLRLGQYREAVADYDAALKLQPKLPWSLYGRGLAKRKLGMTAEGEADVKAGVALDPTLPGKAKRIGLIEAGAETASASGGATPAAPAGKR